MKAPKARNVIAQGKARSATPWEDITNYTLFALKGRNEIPQRSIYFAPSALFDCFESLTWGAAPGYCIVRLRRLSLPRSHKMKANYDFSTEVKNPSPKRMIVSVTIENVRDGSKSLSCEAFVDTAASLMVLPTAWKDRLGDLELTRTVELGTHTRGTIMGEVYGPVRIQLDGFRPIFTEVSFAEMKPEDDECKPLIGHIVLAQSQAAVDILGHRLVLLKHMDLKMATY